MSNIVTSDVDAKAFQIPGMSQGPETDPYAGFGQEYAAEQNPEAKLEEDLLDLYGEVPDDASSLFEAEDARQTAMNVAVSSQEAPKSEVNVYEVLRFTANVGHELTTWRHISVAGQDPEFIDALRAKAKNGRF